VLTKKASAACAGCGKPLKVHGWQSYEYKHMTVDGGEERVWHAECCPQCNGEEAGKEKSMRDAVRIPGSSGHWSELWEVQSDSRPASYVVAKDRQGRWGCSCPAWIFHTPRRDCKHIRHVVAQVARNVQARTMTEAEVASKPAIKKALSRFALIEV
jgi:hypothetical protein